jgi:endonuclease-3
MKSANPLRRRARRLVRLLAERYPDARCALDYANPLQLLVATILSAQCTDVRVNRVTPALFTRYPDAAAYAGADRAELEGLIQSTGFFRNKARNLRRCCQQIVEKHGGQVPRTMAELVPLAGIGRKTANVLLGNPSCNRQRPGSVPGTVPCPGEPWGVVAGVVVDTHVGRLSRRLGLTVQTNPVKVERDLMDLIPRKEWTLFGHRMIYHGRQVCHARKPRCSECALVKLCPKVGVEKSG